MITTLKNMRMYNVQGKNWNKTVKMLKWLALGGDIEYF